MEKQNPEFTLLNAMGSESRDWDQIAPFGSKSKDCLIPFRIASLPIPFCHSLSNNFKILDCELSDVGVRIEL